MKEPQKINDSKSFLNTDKEIWREDDNHYAPSIHITKDQLIGINMGGTVIQMPVREWHKLATNGGWINARISPPAESGRYWCIVVEQNELGKSHYQWNCSYNSEDNEWGDNKHVIYWMPLMPYPCLINQ